MCGHLGMLPCTNHDVCRDVAMRLLWFHTVFSTQIYQHQDFCGFYIGLIVCWSALTVAEPHWTGRFHFPMLLTQIAWLTSAKNATNSRMETDKLTIGPFTLDTTDPYPPNHMLSPFLKLAWTSQISPNILKHQPRTSHMTIVYLYIYIDNYNYILYICTLAP
jgi:hypothetical protein